MEDGKTNERFPTIFEKSAMEYGKMLKRFPTNSEYWEWKMEKCGKDSLRTPNVGIRRWKNAEKIPYELRILGMEDIKMLKRFPTNSEYRECKMERRIKDFRRSPDIGERRMERC